MGLFTALSGVLAWCLGSQGLAAAQKAAAGAEAAKRAVAGRAASAAALVAHLEQDARLASRALAIAMTVPGVRQKIEESLPRVDDDPGGTNAE